ncbi:MAG TPA: hypothetical protein VGM16_11225 [Gammaproteobacteria bacterium]
MTGTPNGQGGLVAFRAGGSSSKEDEVVPGRPRGAWLGLRYNW